MACEAAGDSRYICVDLLAAVVLLPVFVVQTCIMGAMLWRVVLQVPQLRDGGWPAAGIPAAGCRGTDQREGDAEARHQIHKAIWRALH